MWDLRSFQSGTILPKRKWLQCILFWHEIADSDGIIESLYHFIILAYEAVFYVLHMSQQLAVVTGAHPHVMLKLTAFLFKYSMWLLVLDSSDLDVSSSYFAGTSIKRLLRMSSWSTPTRRLSVQPSEMPCISSLEAFYCSSMASTRRKFPVFNDFIARIKFTSCCPYIL